MIISAKIRISVDYTDFITQNVHPADKKDRRIKKPGNHPRLLWDRYLLIHKKTRTLSDSCKEVHRNAL